MSAPALSPHRYPLLTGMALPCSLHMVDEDERCPCLEQVVSPGRALPDRMRYMLWHQLPVFERIPHLRTTHNGDRYLCRRDLGPGSLDTVYLVPECRFFYGDLDGRMWKLGLLTRPGPDNPVRRAVSEATPPVTHEQVITSLVRWTQAGPSTIDGIRALGDYWAQVPAAQGTGTLAQDLWSVGPVRPPLCDGRFTAAGVTESYPGAWPEEVVHAITCNDLSAVWPYLDGPETL